MQTTAIAFDLVAPENPNGQGSIIHRPRFCYDLASWRRERSVQHIMENPLRSATGTPSVKSCASPSINIGFADESLPCNMTLVPITGTEDSLRPGVCDLVPTEMRIGENVLTTPSIVIRCSIRIAGEATTEDTVSPTPISASRSFPALGLGLVPLGQKYLQ